jgi:hypothetical protein
MDVDRVQWTWPEILEFVRRVGRDHENLADSRLDVPIADSEQSAAAADHESFGIGMAVQLRPAARPVDMVGDDTDIRVAGLAFPLAMEALEVRQPFGGLGDRGLWAALQG